MSELDNIRRSLPVAKYEYNIVNSVINNNVTILVGETGSGKTTQVPQYLYKHRKNIISNNSRIFREVITQPRRVAAITVANRVADEMGVVIGDKVGYAVRFDDNTNNNTNIKFCTDGILLREAVIDSTLSRYNIIIIDEIHERSLYTDTVLGLVSNTLSDNKLRQNIKVVLMSATVVANKFKDYFIKSGCSVNTVVVPGRTHPVTIYYTPTPEIDFLEAAQLTIIQILLGIEDKNNTGKRRDGDILVFLPGVDNIISLHASLDRLIPTINRIYKNNNSGGGGCCCSSVDDNMVNIKICDLYSSQSRDKQKEAFIPSKNNEVKIILSTNIAETSVTISGITTVIDSGLAKTRVFDTLRISPISQASAAQRAGRAGRERPGVCYRLYTELSYNNDMIKYSIPEILRSDMSYVLLQLLAMGVIGSNNNKCKDLIDFPFVDKPSPKRIRMASRLLRRIGAIGSDLSSPTLTIKGHRMAQYPLEPLICNILVTEELRIKDGEGGGRGGAANNNNNCLAEILTLVAMLSTDNIFISSGNIKNNNKISWFNGLNTRIQNVDGGGRAECRGDHVCLVELYNTWKNISNDNNANIVWCNKRDVSHNALLKAKYIRQQIKDILTSSSSSGRGGGEGRRKGGCCYIDTCGSDWSLLRHAICRGLWTNTYQRITDITNNNSSRVVNGSLSGIWYSNINNSNDKVQVSPMSVSFTLTPNESPNAVVTNEIISTTKPYMRYITPINMQWLIQDQPKYFTTPPSPPSPSTTTRTS